jgi:hypothetical protein
MTNSFYSLSSNNLQHSTNLLGITHHPFPTPNAPSIC